MCVCVSAQAEIKPKKSNARVRKLRLCYSRARNSRLAFTASPLSSLDRAVTGLFLHQSQVCVLQRCGTQRELKLNLYYTILCSLLCLCDSEEPKLELESE